MSCDEVRELLLGSPFNCWDAVMLDGGGSSTLVVEDTNADADCNPRGADDLCVKNNPSDGAPRTVANHLAITWEDAPDARCARPNGKWCEGTTIAQCEGGRFGGSGDCAAYGATCQEDGDFAFCVDGRCPDGDGLRRYACVDGTVLEGCNDGVYGTGDCAAFGLVCGADASGAACMDSRCAAGPNSGFCLSDGTLATCAAGVYAETACPDGTTCADGGCEAPGDPGDSGTGDGGDGGSGSGDGGSGDGGGGNSPGARVALDDLRGGCGCASADRYDLVAALAACLAAGLRRRGRPPPTPS